MTKRLLPNGVAFLETGVSKVGKGKTPGRLAERLPRELGAKVGAPPAPAPGVSGMGRVVRRKAASDI